MVLRWEDNQWMTHRSQISLKRYSLSIEDAAACYESWARHPLQPQAHNAPNHSRRKWLNDVLRNDCSINFHLNKLSIDKFSILYYISLVWDWKIKLKLITLGSKRVKGCEDTSELNQLPWPQAFICDRYICNYVTYLCRYSRNHEEMFYQIPKCHP